MTIQHTRNAPAGFSTAGAFRVAVADAHPGDCPFCPGPEWVAEANLGDQGITPLNGGIMKIRVNGIPAPQGSKRPVRLGSGPAARFGMAESSKKVGPWREAVRSEVQAAYLAGQIPFPGHGDTPVKVTLRFYLPRPRNHYGTGRNAGQLLPSAPSWPAVRPDVDKLARSTLDGLKTGGAYSDDSQVVSLTAYKIYAFDGDTPGADIEIEAADHA
jgi:crossover junction endodeoxyribonuclease RusA